MLKSIFFKSFLKLTNFCYSIEFFSEKNLLSYSLKIKNCCFKWLKKAYFYEYFYQLSSNIILKYSVMIYYYVLYYLFRKKHNLWMFWKMSIIQILSIDNNKENKTKTNFNNCWWWVFSCYIVQWKSSCYWHQSWMNGCNYAFVMQN